MLVELCKEAQIMLGCDGRKTPLCVTHLQAGTAVSRCNRKERRKNGRRRKEMERGARSFLPDRGSARLLSSWSRDTRFPRYWSLGRASPGWSFCRLVRDSVSPALENDKMRRGTRRGWAPAVHDPALSVSEKKASQARSGAMRDADYCEG